MRKEWILGLVIAPLAWAQATLEIPNMDTASMSISDPAPLFVDDVSDYMPLAPSKEVQLPALNEPVDPVALKEAQEALKNNSPAMGPALPELSLSEGVLQQKEPKQIEIAEDRPSENAVPHLQNNSKVINVGGGSSTHSPSSKAVFVIDPKTVRGASSSVAQKSQLAKKKKPEGFAGSVQIGEYWVDGEFDLDEILAQGKKMDDKFYLPGAPWGLALFPGGSPDELMLMLSHRLGDTQQPLGAFGEDNQQYMRLSSDLLYVHGRPAYGAVSLAHLDRYSSKPTALNLALAGTLNNSFGVATPWGTFLSYSQPTDHKGVFFEVSSQRKGLSPAAGLEELGSGLYSAMQIDSNRQVIYLASSKPRGYLFRYKPSLWGNLSAGGAFEVLCVQRWPQADSRNTDPSKLQMQVGGYYQTYWLPVDSSDLFGVDVIENAVEFGEIADMAWLAQKLYWVISDTGKGGAGQLFEFDGYNLRLVEEYGQDDSASIANPVALASLGRGLLLATYSQEGGALYWQAKDSQWKQLWQRESAIGLVGDLAVDPLTRFIYMSSPKEGKVLRLRKK